jgi:hypothetical protein
MHFVFFSLRQVRVVNLSRSIITFNGVSINQSVKTNPLFRMASFCELCSKRANVKYEVPLPCAQKRGGQCANVRM